MVVLVSKNKFHPFLPLLLLPPSSSLFSLCLPSLPPFSLFPSSPYLLLSPYHPVFPKGAGVTPEEYRCSQHHLISEILDNLSVSKQDLQEMNRMWDTIGQKSTDEQEQLDAAYKVLSLVCRFLAWEQGYLTLCSVRMYGCNDNCLLSEQYILHTPTQ